MRRSILGLLLLLTGQVFSQTALKRYTISSAVDNECTSNVSLVLFDESAKLDKLNRLIINRLTDHHYLFQKNLVSLENFYRSKTFGTDSPLMFTILSACTFSRGGVYSFAGCPFNACDSKPTSEMEACKAVIDSVHQKALIIDDIIDPKKMDSLEKFILRVVNMYRIRTIPSCSYSSASPLMVKTQNNVSVSSNVVTYEKGLDPYFLLDGENIKLYNLATHSAYIYKVVELSMPIVKLRHFLKPEYADRLIKNY